MSTGRATGQIVRHLSDDGLPLQIGSNAAKANALADGSAALAAGIPELLESEVKDEQGQRGRRLPVGVKRDADKPSMAGFNIPPRIFEDEFKKGMNFPVGRWSSVPTSCRAQIRLPPRHWIRSTSPVLPSSRDDTETRDATIVWQGFRLRCGLARDY